MAKRTQDPRQDPDQGAQNPTFQIPEVPRTPPDPSEVIAAGVDPLPGRPPSDGGITAGLPGKPKAKPSLSEPMDDYDPDAQQRSRNNQYGPVLTLERPARGRASIVGTELLGTCAIANQLGTREPTRALITKSKDRKWFFIMPVHHTTAKSVPVTYRQKQAFINLFGPFEEMGRIVAKGYKEHYHMEMTEQPIVIHDVKGFALYFSLAEYGKEAIGEREEQDAESPAMSNASSTAKTRSKVGTASKGSTANPNSTTRSSASTGQESTDSASSEESSTLVQEEDDLHEMIKEYNEMLDNRDATINEMKAKLQAFEAKFGKLEA